MSESNYMNVKYFKTTSLAILLATFASGCSFLDRVAPDNTKEYREARTMEALEVPPDLATQRINDDVTGTQESTATYSEYQEATDNPLAAKYGVAAAAKPSLAGDGETRHLVVPGEYDMTWQRVSDFWVDESVDIKREDKRIGLMDTETDGDDYAYRVRVDHGDSSKLSNVYISGLGDDVNKQKDEAMLRQLADYLGVLNQEDQVIADAQKRTQVKQATVVVILVNDPNEMESLLVEQDYTDVWRRVGRILDTKGFTVEDRDRAGGTYFIRYIDPFSQVKEDDGFFDSMAFWRDDEDKTPEEFYHIKLISAAENTKVIILDNEQVRTNSASSKRLLALLKEQLSY